MYKKLIKRVFNLLRRLDRRIVRTLAATNEYSPPTLHKHSIGNHYPDTIVKFDNYAFKLYSNNPKGASLISLYVAFRNKVFIKTYRIVKKLLR